MQWNGIGVYLTGDMKNVLAERPGSESWGQRMMIWAEALITAE